MTAALDLSARSPSHERTLSAPETPWQEEARYLANGLPANMAAVLHDQWKRTKHRRIQP